MPVMQYKVVEAKNTEDLQTKLNEEGAQGWRVVSIAQGPRGYIHAVMEKPSEAA